MLFCRHNLHFWKILFGFIIICRCFCPDFSNLQLLFCISQAAVHEGIQLPGEAALGGCNGSDRQHQRQFFSDTGHQRPRKHDSPSAEGQVVGDQLYLATKRRGFNKGLCYFLTLLLHKTGVFIWLLIGYANRRGRRVNLLLDLLQ